MSMTEGTTAVRVAAVTGLLMNRRMMSRQPLSRPCWRIRSEVFALAGARYPAPVLVLYRGSTMSGCGPASARMGPFYCPEDRKVYVDLGFFDDLWFVRGVKNGRLSNCDTRAE